MQELPDDEQAGAEAVDEEVVGEDDLYPPDRPVAVDEEQVPDSFEERGRREDPEGLDSERPVIQPYQDAAADLLDDESELVAEETVDPDRFAGAEEAAIHET
jgi:hypothetical protein